MSSSKIFCSFLLSPLFFFKNIFLQLSFFSVGLYSSIFIYNSSQPILSITNSSLFILTFSVLPLSPSLSSFTHKSQGHNLSSPPISHRCPHTDQPQPPSSALPTSSCLFCTNPSSLISCTALDLTMMILSFWWLPDLASAGLRFSDYVSLAGFSVFIFYFLVFPIWIFG